MTERSLEARPKFEYTIRAINVTPEQSFPPRNSIEKQGCCVLLQQGSSFGGVGAKPDISGRDQSTLRPSSNCDSRAEQG